MTPKHFMTKIAEDIARDALEGKLTTPEPISAHGYMTQISSGVTYEEGTDNEVVVPPSVQTVYLEGEHEFSVMVGRSPVDNLMVIHVDTAETIPLSRLYINDDLGYGTEKDGTTAPPFVPPNDFGGSQRFLLAERLYRQAHPEPAPSLFDAPADVQQVWFRVTGEAITALLEESTA